MCFPGTLCGLNGKAVVASWKLMYIYILLALLGRWEGWIGEEQMCVAMKGCRGITPSHLTLQQAKWIQISPLSHEVIEETAELLWHGSNNIVPEPQLPTAPRCCSLVPDGTGSWQTFAFAAVCVSEVGIPVLLLSLPRPSAMAVNKRPDAPRNIAGAHSLEHPIDMNLWIPLLASPFPLPPLLLKALKLMRLHWGKAKCYS